MEHRANLFGNRLVTAKTTPVTIRPERVAELISDWFIQRGFKYVVLKQNSRPQVDPNDSYVIEYEATFVPARIEQAQVEVWATNDGYVAIGVETTARVAERLRVQSRGSRFAAGHEPREMSEAGLLALLDCVAKGQIAISARLVPLLGLISTEAVALTDCRGALRAVGYEPVEWLKGERRIKRFSHLMRFEPWS